jgi:hypothetical protein
MFAGLLPRGEVPAFAEAEHHVEKPVILAAVRDGVVFAPDSADADTSEREDAGLDRRLANQFHDRAHIDAPIEIA